MFLYGFISLQFFMWFVKNAFMLSVRYFLSIDNPIKTLYLLCFLCFMLQKVSWSCSVWMLETVNCNWPSVSFLTSLECMKLSGGSHKTNTEALLQLNTRQGDLNQSCAHAENIWVSLPVNWGNQIITKVIQKDKEVNGLHLITHISLSYKSTESMLITLPCYFLPASSHKQPLKWQQRGRWAHCCIQKIQISQTKTWGE